MVIMRRVTVRVMNRRANMSSVVEAVANHPRRTVQPWEAEYEGFAEIAPIAVVYHPW